MRRTLPEMVAGGAAEGDAPDGVGAPVVVAPGVADVAAPDPPHAVNASTSEVTSTASVTATDDP
jgi:hypothetical protein